MQIGKAETQSTLRVLMPVLNNEYVKLRDLSEKSKKLVSAVLCCAVLCNFTRHFTFVNTFLKNFGKIIVF